MQTLNFKVLLLLTSSLINLCFLFSTCMNCEDFEDSDDFEECKNCVDSSSIILCFLFSTSSLHDVANGTFFTSRTGSASLTNWVTCRDVK